MENNNNTENKENGDIILLDTAQYIVVKIGSEQYGIDINYVDNIIRMERITRVPKSQKYFKGVINVRGEIIPVMSLRLKFNLGEDVITNNTRIIIIKTDIQALVGVLVDEVKEVVTLDVKEIEKPTYDSSKDEKIAFLVGVGKHKDGLISLLNINSVISDKEAL